MQHIACWTQESSPNDSLSIIRELALSHCREGGNQGKRIADYIISGDFLSVCDFDMDYDGISAYAAGNCRQALAFFSKYAGLSLGTDRRETAKSKFREAESACAVTNDIFRQRDQGSFLLEPWVESALYRASQKISRVLGDVPSPAQLKLRFGPGATTLTKKSAASSVEKLQAGFSCSEDLLPSAAMWIEELPHLLELHGGYEYSRLSDRELCTRVPVRLTHGIVEFVPKNAKTHRSIIKEGSLNTLVQLALGDWMVKRMARFGLDLTDQSRNQQYAREGSLSGNLATLDLSSASDTISSGIVSTLLPLDWDVLLSAARSSTVLMDGEELKLEKFSSMGNGFTFPLETLIFWALCSSICENDDVVSVYGDDIIVPVERVTQVIRLLEVCGFSINMEKSYWTGPFRESCGADYLRGIDIRPYYQKNLVSPAELFRLHNFYARHCDSERADFVKSLLNPSLCIYGPDGFGDGHLLGDWIPRRHKRWDTHGYGGVLFDTFTLIGRRDERALRPGDRVLPLYSIYLRDEGNPVLSELEPRSLDALPGFLGRNRKFQTRELGLPIPERKSPVDGALIKCPSTPGTLGYKRISIYTLATGG
jgi:hypothetical protein